MKQQTMPLAVMRARAHEEADNFGQAGREWLIAGAAAERAEDRIHAAEYAHHAARCYRKWQHRLNEAARPRPAGCL